MPRVAIKATGLEKWFGEGEAKTVALRDVNLETASSEKWSTSWAPREAARQLC